MSAGRLYQWKLRTLFVAIAVVALLLALRRPYLRYMVLRHEAAKQTHLEAWRHSFSSGAESAAGAEHRARYHEHRKWELQYRLAAEDPFFTGPRAKKPQ